MKTQNYLLLAILGAAIGLSAMMMFLSYAVMEQMFQVEENSSWSPIINWCTLIVPVEAQIALTLWYSSILHSIYTRFRMINMTLRNYSYFSRHRKDPSEADAEIAIIDRLTKLHDAMTDAVAIVNKCYAFPVRKLLKKFTPMMNSIIRTTLFFIDFIEIGCGILGNDGNSICFLSKIAIQTSRNTKHSSEYVGMDASSVLSSVRHYFDGSKNDK